MEGEAPLMCCLLQLPCLVPCVKHMWKILQTEVSESPGTNPASIPSNHGLNAKKKLWQGMHGRENW